MKLTLMGSMYIEQTKSKVCVKEKIFIAVQRIISALWVKGSRVITKTKCEKMTFLAVFN